MNKKIKKVAFTSHEGIVKGVNFYIPFVEDEKDILNELHKKIKPFSALEVSSFSNTQLGRKVSIQKIKYRGKYLESILADSGFFEENNSSEYVFDGHSWDFSERKIFFDYLYVEALSVIITENDAKELLKYEYFTDITYNSKKVDICPARNVAIAQLMIKRYKRIIPFLTKETFIAFYDKYSAN